MEHPSQTDTPDDRPANDAARSEAGGRGGADADARPSSEPTIQVTAIELFFDLIFAFTLTQLTVLLIQRLTAVRVLQVLLIFGLLWWMYSGYSWLTNARPPVRSAERLLLILGMAGFLIAGLAIPNGFAGDGVALGLGYLLVVCVHTALYHRVNRNILRVAPFSLISGLLVLGAGFTSGVPDYVLWVAALVILVGSPLIVRVSGRFDIRPAHFAERHGALIIVALGESVAAIGIGAAKLAVDASLVIAATAGLAMSAVLWWAYFGNGDDERGQHAMSAAPRERRPNLALSAYFYGHTPMLLGIVFIAAGVRAATQHGGGANLGAALALGAGAAAFMSGTAAFRAALRTGPTGLRLLGSAFALWTVPIGAGVSIEAQLVVLAAGLALMLVRDQREASAGTAEA